MQRSVVALALVVVLLTPGALAASAQADRLALDAPGTRAEATGAAFFTFLSDPRVSWSATASFAVLERTYQDWLFVDGPLPTMRSGSCDVTVQVECEPLTETLDFRQLEIRSVGLDPAGVLFARGIASPFDAEVAIEDRASVRAERDPAFTQAPPYDVYTTGGDRWFPNVNEQLEGSFLNITTGAARFTLSGTLLVVPAGLSYEVASQEGSYSARSGRFVIDSVGPFVKERTESHVLILTDAVLTIHVPHEAYLAATDASLTFDGTLVAEGAADLAALGLVPSSDGAWRGATSLDLAPDGGLVAVAAPATLASSGAGLGPRADPSVAWAAGGLAFVVLAIVGFALLRRRAQDEDHVALALLAMEDRRWDDALPHLTRALAKKPEDAALHVDRAICLEELGRLQEARVDYEAALEQQPFNAEAHYYYARTLARLRLSTTSLAHLSRALSLDARLRELAQRERAFAAFGDHPQFRALVG